ncbi:MAG: MFS transporter [Aquabacterium sp.]
MSWLPRYYGWRITAASFGLQMLNATLLMQAFGAYVAVLSQELGWSKTALSAGAAIQALEGALIGPLLGWMIDRVGPRLVVQVGVVLFAAGLALFSQIGSLPGFYGAMLLIALGASMCGYFPLSVCLVHFFRRQRTRALALMSLGLAAGGLALPVIGWAMQSGGWRHTALGSAVVVLLVGLPLAQVLRRHPGEVGQFIDGEPQEQAAASAAASAAQGRDFSAMEAVRTRAFWLLGVAHGLALLVVTAVNVHAISHLTQGLGYTLQQASFIITLMTVAQGGGILLGAATGDRWNKRKAAAACMLAHGAGLLALTFASHPALLVAFGLLHGVAWGLRGPFMQAIRADYFGLKAIGTIMGFSAAIIAVGQVAGPMVAGALADATGSYQSGFVLLALLSASGSAMFMLARKPA